MQPEGIIADEPIPALDVSIRAQVLSLLAQLQKSNDLACSKTLTIFVKARMCFASTSSMAHPPA